MHYSLCPYCFSNLFSPIVSNTSTITCSLCKKSFLRNICISYNDIIIPIITSELTEELLHCFLNLAIESIESSNSAITQIKRICFNLDECIFPIIKLTNTQITSVGDFNTSIRYRFTHKHIISTNFNVIFVFGRGAGIWCDDYSPYNYIKYAKKVIIIPNNRTMIADFIHLFKSLNNLDKIKKISLPIALFNVSDLTDDLLLIIKTEFSKCTIIPYAKNIDHKRIIDYSLLIKWITEH